MSIKGEAEDISRKEDDINKKKKSEAVVSKQKSSLKKIKKIKWSWKIHKSHSHSW